MKNCLFCFGSCRQIKKGFSIAKKPAPVKVSYKLPSLSRPLNAKAPGELKKGQHLFKFDGKNFVVEKWGINNKKTSFIGIQKLLDMEPVGGFLAIASYSPFEKKVTGLNLKAWSIKAWLQEKTLQDSGNSVIKRLVEMIQLKAGDAEVKALVANPSDPKTNGKLWESMGFKSVNGTGFFVKQL